MSKINSMENIISQIKKIGLNIHNEIQPLLKNIQPLTLDKYFEYSNIKEKNKKYYKNLFKRYIEYCNKDYIKNEIIANNSCPLDMNKKIYVPSNVLAFLKEKYSFQRTFVKKILNVFLRALRKCTQNPNLEYPSSLGQITKSYIKHFSNTMS